MVSFSESVSKDDLRSNYYGSVARQFLHLGPVWMDIEDLMQDARLAHFQGRKLRYGILDGLRKSRRMVHHSSKKKGRERYFGWEISVELLGKIQEKFIQPVQD